VGNQVGSRFGSKEKKLKPGVHYGKPVTPRGRVGSNPTPGATAKPPVCIAVNMSEWVAVADGLSHTCYLKLVETLGEKYAKRLVSAGQLITDFRTGRVTSEIVAYANLCETTRQILERALSNEVITPGVTTREDVAWWVQDRLLVRGMVSSFELSMPSVIHSANPLMFLTRLHALKTTENHIPANSFIFICLSKV